jgi:putative cell wall-binding protein
MLKLKKSLVCLMSAVTILGTMAPNALAAYTLVPPAASVQGTLSVMRVAGADRVKTSVKVADAGWTQSDYAVIAYAWDFPDAVSATPLAYKYNAPILLTDTANLNADTSAELTKLGVKHALIVGGNGAVSANVESQITALGIDIQRFSGPDRYATSVAIANAVGNTGSIVITNGYNPYEALSISPIAAKLGMPILLTARDSVPAEISGYISSNSITQTYVLGKADGTTSDDGVADNPVFPNPTRITGANLYQRNINIVKLFSSNLNFSKVYLATGKAFADALAGSALAAESGSPLIFVDNDMPPVTKDFIASVAGSVSNVCVLGGQGAISDDTVQSVKSLLGSSESVVSTPVVPTTSVTPVVPAPVMPTPVTTTPVVTPTPVPAPASNIGAAIDSLVSTGTITQSQALAIRNGVSGQFRVAMNSLASSGNLEQVKEDVIEIKIPDAMTAAFKSSMDSEVTSGLITQNKENIIISDYQSNIQTAITSLETSGTITSVQGTAVQSTITSAMSN